MYNQQQFQPSAEHVNQQNFIPSGLPYNVPYLPQLQISPVPEVQAMLPLIMGYFILEIQNQARKTAARTYLFNLLSDNYYGNNEFLQSLHELGEYVDYILGTDAQAANNPEGTIATCASDWATILTGWYAANTPQVANMLDLRARQDMQMVVQEYNQLRAAISAYQRGGQSMPIMHPPMGGQPQDIRNRHGWNAQGAPAQMAQGYQQGGNWQGGGQQPGGYMQNQGMAMQPAHARMQQGSRAAPNWQGPNSTRKMARGGVLGNGRSQAAAPAPAQAPARSMFADEGGNRAMSGQGNQRRMTGGLRPRANTTPDNDHTTMEEWGDDSGYQDFRSEQQRQHDADQRQVRAEQQTAAPVAPANQRFVPTRTASSQPLVSDGLPSVSIQETVEETTPMAADNERPFDYFVYEGKEYRPAFLSPWTRTFTIEQPYRMAWNPQKEMLFHACDSQGVVTEVTIPLSEAMDYLKHDLFNTLRKERSSKRDAENLPVGEFKQAGGNWAELQKLEPVPAESEAPLDEDIVKGGKPIVLPEIMLSHGLDQARFLATCHFAARGIKAIPETVPQEFYYRDITPVFVRDEDPEIQDTFKEIVALTRCETVTMLVNRLTKLFGRIEDRLWYLLHDGYTKRFNDALAYNMQMEGWAIDSITSDWDDLQQALRDKFGTVTGEQLFNTLLTKGATDILSGAWQLLTGDDLEEYLKQHDGLEVPRENVILLSNAHSVTMVPWSISETTLKIDEDGGSIIEQSFPELYKAVEALFERTRRTGEDFNSHTIETRDGERYKLYRGYFSSKHFLIVRD